MALVELDLARPGFADEVPFRIVACIWRIAERHLTAVEAAIGQPVGGLAPYGFPGWEAECDALEWICADNALAFSGHSGRSAEEQRRRSHRCWRGMR